jgi:hypothetical protein
MKRTEFDKIKNICINEDNSWQDKFFLAFDIDWASDEVLEFTRHNLEIAVSCFFALYIRLIQNKKYYIGKYDNVRVGFDVVAGNNREHTISIADIDKKTVNFILKRKK